MALFRLQNLTIKNKLIMISMFTSGVALVVTLVAILSGAFYATRSATLENISSIARVIGTNCEAALTFDDPDAANKTLKALAAEPQIDCSRIYREDGSLFAQYHRDNDNKAHADKAAHSAYSEIQAVLDGRSGSGSHRFEANSLKVLVPIVLDRNMIGVVEVSSDLRALYRRLTTVTLICLAILLLSFLVAYAVSTMAQRTISGPITKLTRTMNRVSRNKDYSTRVETDSFDELGILFDGFNEMLSEIQARDEQLHFTQFSVDHMGDAAYWMDRQGRIVNVNTAACESLGLKREALLAMSFGDIDPTLGRERWREIWEKARTRKSITFETDHLQTDGKLVPVEVYANFLEFEGKAYLCAFARDIAERKSLQTQLEQAQKMEAIGTLAGGVAHDLNNILGGLVGYPDLLLMDLPEDSPLRGPLVTVKTSGEKAAAIVQDMLTLARRGVDLRSAVNLNEVVADYWRSPEHGKIQQFHEGVSFEINLDPDQPNILGSEIHLSKTLMNLVSNAAEAMPNGGRVQVSTFRCHLDDKVRGYQSINPGDYAVLRVEDEGSGMSDEDMRHIFEPFYTKKKMGRSGTGLGMSVVSGTVKDHKGYIDLKSIEGRGTRFDLYFPISGQMLQAKGGNFNIDDFKGNERVLVVDDVMEQREIATVVLRKLGYQVESVSSGEEAVAYMEKGSVDLLVLDMIMDPGMDGLETYRQILSLHPNQKAVVASGFSETERVRQIMALGVGAYVRKPYSIEGLGRAVREMLDS